MTRAKGLQHVDRAVDDVDFSRHESRGAGEARRDARGSGGERFTLGDMLAHVPHRHFRDADEFIERPRTRVPQLME